MLVRFDWNRSSGIWRILKLNEFEGIADYNLCFVWSFDEF